MAGASAAFRVLGCGLALGFLAACASAAPDNAGLTTILATIPHSENISDPSGGASMDPEDAYIVPEETMMALGGPRPKPQILAANHYMQCVPFARELSGIAIRGDAYLWWQMAEGLYRKAHKPQVGAVFVMEGYNTDARGHVAVVKRLLTPRVMVVDHANWLNDGKLHVDTPIKDVSPNNDWSMVRVWLTPASRYGSRVYTAKGFLLQDTRARQMANAARIRFADDYSRLLAAAPEEATRVLGEMLSTQPLTPVEAQKAAERRRRAVAASASSPRPKPAKPAI